MTLLNTLSKKNELIEKLESENACLKLKLSANNAKWREKIEEYFGHYDAMYFTDWKKIQYQMKEGE